MSSGTTRTEPDGVISWGPTTCSSMTSKAHSSPSSGSNQSSQMTRASQGTPCAGLWHYTGRRWTWMQPRSSGRRPSSTCTSSRDCLELPHRRCPTSGSARIRNGPNTPTTCQLLFFELWHKGEREWAGATVSTPGFVAVIDRWIQIHAELNVLPRSARRSQLVEEAWSLRDKPLIL